MNYSLVKISKKSFFCAIVSLLQLLSFVNAMGQKGSAASSKRTRENFDFNSPSIYSIIYLHSQI